MDLLISGLQQVFVLGNLSLIAAGLVIGIVIGAIPGLNVPLAVAIALPITFNLSPIGGLAMLIGIYKGGTYGGSLSAVLINVPDTPAAAATAVDGWALTRQGKAGKALKMSLSSYSRFRWRCSRSKSAHRRPSPLAYSRSPWWGCSPRATC